MGNGYGHGHWPFGGDLDPLVPAIGIWVTELVVPVVGQVIISFDGSRVKVPAVDRRGAGEGEGFCKSKLKPLLVSAGANLINNKERVTGCTTRYVCTVKQTNK